MFSPNLAILEVISSATVWLPDRSLIKCCSYRHVSSRNLPTRPSIIFSITAGGLPLEAAWLRSTSFSRSKTSGGTSSLRRYLGSVAQTCMARSCANSWNSSVRATKSLSQLTSTITAIFDPG